MKAHDFQVGDVWRAPSGAMRIARAVHICGNDPCHWFIYFTIRHCSWTHRPYTLYCVAELFGLGYRKIDKRVRVQDRFQRLLAEDVESNEKVNKLNFHCCDVRGIP